MIVEHRPSLLAPPKPPPTTSPAYAAIDTLRNRVRFEQSSLEIAAAQAAIKIKAIELLDKLPLKLRAEFVSDLADAYYDTYEATLGVGADDATEEEK